MAIALSSTTWYLHRGLGQSSRFITPLVTGWQLLLLWAWPSWRFPISSAWALWWSGALRPLTVWWFQPLRAGRFFWLGAGRLS